MVPTTNENPVHLSVLSPRVLNVRHDPDVTQEYMKQRRFQKSVRRKTELIGERRKHTDHIHLSWKILDKSTEGVKLRKRY